MTGNFQCSRCLEDSILWKDIVWTGIMYLCRSCDSLPEKLLRNEDIRIIMDGESYVRS